MSSSLLSFKQYKAKNNESYMCVKQLNHFSSILQDWKNHLLAGINETLSGMRDREQYADEVDVAAQDEQFRLELNARARDNKLLKSINESLGNIKSGDYGYCRECDAEIGVQRLQARPTTSRCVECKTVAELKAKQLINS